MIAAKEAVREDIGKVAVMRGPVVYCLEETDNGKDLQKLLIDPELNVTVSDGNICGTPVKKLTAAGFRQLDTHIEKESEALYHVRSLKKRNFRIFRIIPGQTAVKTKCRFGRGSEIDRNRHKCCTIVRSVESRGMSKAKGGHQASGRMPSSTFCMSCGSGT